MADFAQALPWVLNHEVIGWPVGVSDVAAGMAHVQALGKEHFWFTDDPDDAGGATAWGLTLYLAKAYGIGTVDDLKAISDEKLAQVYRAAFWRFDALDQRVATKLLDLAVNEGLHPAIHLVQAVLYGLGVEITQDGAWGPNTQTAILASSPTAILDGLVEEACDYYQTRVVNRPQSAKFLAGWLIRAKALPPVEPAGSPAPGAGVAAELTPSADGGSSPAVAITPDEGGAD